MRGGPWWDPQPLTRGAFCRRAPPVDPEILRTMKKVGFIGYAPNPRTKLRNQVPALGSGAAVWGGTELSPCVEPPRSFPWGLEWVRGGILSIAGG